MFKYYKDICDVVSLLAYSPSDRSYLFSKDPSGEFWLPSVKNDKNCWKSTAQKINFEIFGGETSSCIPLRIYKIWLPDHKLSFVYHAVYKVVVKLDVKKKVKIKQGTRARLQWYTTSDLERQRAHFALRSPELYIFAQTAVGDQVKEMDTTDAIIPTQEMELGMVIEICENNVIVPSDASSQAPHTQLLHHAGYNRTEQISIYREFVLMVYPALYMSPHIFTQFMMDIGYEKSQCQSLFRSADVSGRGGLSYLELVLWVAALEPTTQHSGVPAEIRCRYIFRYFDGNRDQKLEYTEFKELVAAARAARHLPADSLNVARDADICLRQLGLQPNTQLTLADFLRGVGELRLRGTSSLLRAPKSIMTYLIDLQERERDQAVNENVLSTACAREETELKVSSLPEQSKRSTSALSAGRRAPGPRQDYAMAVYTVRMHRKAPMEMFELKNFDEEAVSASTIRLMSGLAPSLEVLSPSSPPAEALAAVHYFASHVEKQGVGAKRRSSGGVLVKSPWSWSSQAEEMALGALLLKLAEAVRPLVAAEPRLLRLSAPVYVIGDLHGNLSALLAMEAALWPTGAALAAARLLFLGDFVDRGPHGAELMAYLLASKLQRPNGVMLVRGNHEIRDIQKMFTFHNECVTKYGETEGTRIWSAINNVFDVLPLAAVVDEKVFCCHGGIPPPWVCPLLSAIDKVPSPLPRPAEQSSVAWELLWNDPVKHTKLTATLALELAANEGFAANSKRGTGHVFDQNALDRFLLSNKLSHVVRAHEVQQNGFMCQLRGRLVSVFSSSRYCGGNNDSGVTLLEGGKLRMIRVTDYASVV